MSNKEVLEGEIVSGAPVESSGSRPGSTSLGLPVVDKKAIWLLFASFIPVLGLFAGLIAVFLARLRRKSIIIPVIALVISLFITSIFLVLRFILKAIF